MGVEGDLLFPGAYGAMMRRNGGWVQEMLHRARETAKIPDLTFRMCRTTFSTLWEGDPRDGSSVLGHSDVKLTMRVYRKPIAERQLAAMEESNARLTGKVVPINKQEKAG